MTTTTGRAGSRSTRAKSSRAKPSGATSGRSSSSRSTGRAKSTRSASRSTGGRSGGRVNARAGSRSTRSAGSGRSTSKRSTTRRAADRRGTTGRRRGRRRPTLKVTDVGERNAAYLTTIFVGLTLFGLVMVLSASSVSSLHEFAQSPFYQFKRQVAWSAIGALAFIGASLIDYRLLQRFAGPLMLLCVGALTLLLIPGVGITRNGSTRWLGTGSFVIQPSEFTKLAMIIFVADLLTRRERRMDRPELTVRPVMFVLFAVSGLMALQPKLGTPIILGAVCVLMLFIAGARIGSLALWTSFAAAAVAVLAFVSDYSRARILGFLDPWEYADTIGFQAIQSQVGIASGGLLGVGLGASRAKWGFLPFAHTDFIFAIVAEEVGLLGASALISAFLLVAWLGVRAAMLAPDRFGMLLAFGVTSWLVVQAFLNIGMVLGVAPITGESLPFVSAGGSGLITALAAAGLLVSVARRAKVK